MAAYNKFNYFVQDLGQKIHNLNSDTLKYMLTDVAPVATNHVKTDITEISAGNGYSAGGVPLTGVSYTQTSGVAALAGSTGSWTATGGAIAQFRYVVLYNSTAGSGNLIGWWDNGAEVNIATGNSFTFTPASTANILQDS